MAQKLICKKISTISAFQSAINSQKNVTLPFKQVWKDHVQLLIDRPSHWLLSFLFKWVSTNLQQRLQLFNTIMGKIYSVFL